MKSSKLPYLLATVLALVAAVAMFTYTASTEKRVNDKNASTTALVAVQPVPAGTTLTDALDTGLIKQETLPKTSVPSEALTGVTSSNGDLLALSPVAKGQLLLAANFGEELIDPMTLTIPAGKIAVSADLEDPQKVGGFLAPGSEIVVFATYPNPAKDNEDITRVLLPRVKVLAIGAQIAASQDRGTKAASVVTMAVDQREAQKLVLAQKLGSLYLGLLGPNTTITPDNGTTYGDLDK